MNIVICDDDEVSRNQIEEVCKELGEINGCDIISCASGEELLEMNLSEVKLLVLDVEMEGASGIEVKNRLEENGEIAIIFLTSHSERMKDAFGKNVFGFLKKPIELESFKEIVRRIDNVQRLNKKISINLCTGEIKIIKISDIMYIEANGHYVWFQCGHKKEFVDYGMIYWENVLDSTIFVKVDRSHIVNMYHFFLKENRLLSKTGTIIDVPRRKKDVIKQKMLEFAINYTK